MQNILVEIADVAASVDIPRESLFQHRMTYLHGMFFGRDDIVVERSIEVKGKWVVAIDLIANPQNGDELQSSGEEKLKEIKKRVQTYFKVLDSTKSDQRHLMQLLKNHGDLITNSRNFKYKIHEF